MTKPSERAIRPERRPRLPVRSSLGSILRWLDKLVVLDVILFACLMVQKLYLFNDLLSVQYMDMNDTDRKVETGALLLLSFWTLLLPTRGRILALIGLNLGLSFLLFADVVYYRYFQDLITVPVLLQLGQVESLGGSIHSLLTSRDFWLLADALLLLPFAVYLIWKGRAALQSPASLAAPKPRMTTAIRLGTAAAAFTIGAALFFTPINRATDTWAKGLFEKNWWNLAIYNVAGAVGFHGYDVYRYAQLHWFGSEAVTAEQKSETQAWMESRGLARRELEKDASFGAYRDSNVLMIQVESLQNFVIGKSIGGSVITPVLNDLVQNSAYFSRFYHQTAQGRTSDADFAANCSLLPTKSGSAFIQYASNELSCLPEQLKKEGYAANVFHAYQGGFWNRNVMYNNMDYDQFYSLKHFKMDERLGWSLGDKSFYRQSMDVVAELPQPFHAFMISLTSHHPYKMPEEHNKLDVEELEGTMMGDYLQSIHYADAALGELIERLKAEKLWDQTIFVLYGDHDSAIPDWNLFSRFMEDPNNEAQREHVIKNVPFIVHLPDNAYAGEYRSAGGQLDIAPTVMHLLGLSTAAPDWLGSPLLTEQPEETRLVVQRNGAWTDGTRTYIPSEDGLTANGKCYSADTGDLLQLSECSPMTELADSEITMSDRIITGDLIRDFHTGDAVEVVGEQN
ncbi:LTA synthase family protein [Paenibacillus sp. GCM10027627]|uniref:LTA synthase family protein n=1 Tax=unclassified Paenibacillus TaxID=185978 RepID=UPI00363EB072